MSYKEKDIVFEGAKTFVLRGKTAYTVYRQTITHGEPDSSYELTNDGLSIALARAKYLESRS